jgi:hypothetical protein
MIVSFLEKSQQYLLAYEGLYNGPIDGKWSRSCEEAMISFTKRKDYGDAVKNGNFFKPFELLPSNYMWTVIDQSRAIVINPKIVRVDFEQYINDLLQSCKTGIYSGPKQEVKPEVKQEVKPQQTNVQQDKNVHSNVTNQQNK